MPEPTPTSDTDSPPENRSDEWGPIQSEDIKTSEANKTVWVLSAKDWDNEDHLHKRYLVGINQFEEETDGWDGTPRKSDIEEIQESWFCKILNIVFYTSLRIQKSKFGEILYIAFYPALSIVCMVVCAISFSMMDSHEDSRYLTGISILFITHATVFVRLYFGHKKNETDVNKRLLGCLFYMLFYLACLGVAFDLILDLGLLIDFSGIPDGLAP